MVNRPQAKRWSSLSLFLVSNQSVVGMEAALSATFIIAEDGVSGFTAASHNCT